MRITIALLASLAVSIPGAAQAAEPRQGRFDAVRVSPEVERRFAAGAASVPVLVFLREQPDDSVPGHLSPLQARALAGVSPAQFSPSRFFRNAPALAGRLSASGLAELRARPDVAAISLDGVVRPAGQLGAAQIGADRLAAFGVTGLGRNVAVIDSGIDVSHPDLGGPEPNQKVAGGWNFAAGNADLSDCSGHGTQVAGVVAGPLGIAPDAGLVALKVFGGEGCSEARFSDVLAAVDWAVSRRDPLRIEAINISLADDRVRTAFCDTEDPASAAVFAAARAAGISVVAAAGNDGKLDGIGWPACFSDVAAVGMVYSASNGATAWGGAASCQDNFSGADVVPCASNSGSALSFLAPGVRWVTPTVGGGRSSSFSGTSAAAPAATGALILARQARSLVDPALAMDLLRATGVPVSDTKNGRVSSRIDLSAAFDATSPITGACTSLVIPDGSASGTTCETIVTSLVGKVSSLAVSLSFDHPDPTQLVVTLASPDGTSVLLMNRSGSRDHAFREVFGRTATPVEPLSSFSGRAAEGVWRLHVLDTVPGGSGRILSWALQIEPEAPRTDVGTISRTALVPAAVHGSGRYGSFFTTDLRLFNSDPRLPQNVTLRLRPAAGEEPGPDRLVTLTLPPLGTRVLRDVVGNAFRTNDFGPVFVQGPPQVIIGSRTQANSARGGTYGLNIPSLTPDRAIGAASAPLILIPAYRSSGFRVNVGLTEVAGAECSYEIAVKDSHGAPRGS
ncbi:MAG: S8 family serine peptidase, partial [Thermoanaerobaculia bacterium]